jgi:hypothetical protein
MSWQAQVFERLRDRDWHKIGDLFDEVQGEIPLHTAMRHAMHPNYRRVELPANSEARWRLFRSVLATIGVETDGNPRCRVWSDRVRLRYVADRTCDGCGGPVIKSGWSSRDSVVCLACESGPAPEITAPVPAPIVIAIPRPEPEITPSVGWHYRATRALAEFIKITRLPGLSVSRIVREWERARSLEKFLLSHGKRPLDEREFYRWVASYAQQHPP